MVHPLGLGGVETTLTLIIIYAHAQIVNSFYI
jgi:hypothetical protein